jgi:ferritin-like metal-binding protein YciE
MKDAAALLDETLQEESQTDEDLTTIADAAVNAEATRPRAA